MLWQAVERDRLVAITSRSASLMEHVAGVILIALRECFRFMDCVDSRRFDERVLRCQMALSDTLTSVNYCVEL
jgi:UDP-N-acetylglucosamine transferase subunit ALG13